MLRITLKSLLLLVVSALVGSTVIFLLLRLVGGDAATVIAGTKAPPEAVEALRESLGLNRPLFEQYFSWLGGVLTGNLGESYAARYDIGQEIARRLEPTLTLTLGTLLVSIPIALLIGLYAALNHRKLRGLAVDATMQVGVAIPAFFIALLLVLLFAVQLGWLPAAGYVSIFEDPIANLRYMTLPVATLSVGVTATFTRFVRSSMIEQLNEDYMRTARAKGHTQVSAALRHGLRNAAVPLVAISALQFAALITGVIVVENIFVIPGLGRLLLTAVLGREVIVVQSVMLVIMLMILALNVATDVIYGALDPRIRQRRLIRA